MSARRNPPSFVLIEKATGLVVYTRRATGVGSEAIKGCVDKGRELAARTGKTYTVFLDIRGLKRGHVVSVPMVYALGITEDIGPVQKNPLTRGEAASVLKRARTDIRGGVSYPKGSRRSFLLGRAAGRAETVYHTGPNSRTRHLAGNLDTRAYALQNPGVRENIYVFNNSPSGPADDVAARELELYIDNDSQLYHSQFIPIVKNLMLKRRKGVYNRELAVKLFMYLMDSGAKKYLAEFGTRGQKIDTVFNKNTRMMAARAFRDSFETEAELGNYDRLIGPVSNPEYRVRFTSPDMKFRHATIRAHGTRSALKKANLMAEKLPPEFTAPRSMVEVDRSDVRKNAYVFNNPIAVYEVFVGNIGRVYFGDSKTRADRTYEQYVKYSQQGIGSAAGEDVSLICEGELSREWIAPKNRCGGGWRSSDTRNNPREDNQMEAAARKVGLLVTTWAPGDGTTRYRFFKAGPGGRGRYADYHQGDAVYTAHGRKDAMSFIVAYQMGRHTRRNPARVNCGRGGVCSNPGHRHTRRNPSPIDPPGLAELDARMNDLMRQMDAMKKAKTDSGPQYMILLKEAQAVSKERLKLIGLGSHSIQSGYTKRVRPNPLLQTIGLAANPGSVKTFNEMQDVGKAKYVVNYHDGVKVHRDGSPFFDIAIFRDRAKKDQFVRKLESLGFTRGTLRNPPISQQWDRLTGRQRLEILGFVGFEDTANRYVRVPWNLLSSMVKQALEQYWNDTSSGRGTTRRRSAVAVNPLTRQEAGAVLSAARSDVRMAKVFRPGHTRSEKSGQAYARAQVVRRYGPRAAHAPATKIMRRAQDAVGTTMSNPGVRFPKPGTRLTIAEALAFAQKLGNRELVKQCHAAMKLQKAANKNAKCVIWKIFPMGSSNQIDSVVALTHYGDSPETMYRPPKGSKKGNHMYRHKWGEKGGKPSVPLLASPDGKMLMMPLEGKKVASDWLRH